MPLFRAVGIPPNGVEFYIHRSGRTGRKGQVGKTILLYNKHYDANVDRFFRDVCGSAMGVVVLWV